MTKTCLRLTFLAALAVPLAHGCGDSSLECLGTPVRCENREIAQCTQGCRVFSGCVGVRGGGALVYRTADRAGTGAPRIVPLQPATR